MKRRRWHRGALLAALGCVSMAAAISVLAQGTSRRTSAGAYVAQPAAAPQPAPPSLFGGGLVLAEQAKQQASASLQKLTALQAALRASEGEQRTQLIEQAQQAIRDYFDEDLAHRRDELTRLQNRSAEIEAKLEKRAGMKSELIDLQLKSYKLAAEGLDLPTGTQHPSQTAPTFNRALLSTRELNVFTTPSDAFAHGFFAQSAPSPDGESAVAGRQAALKAIAKSAEKLRAASDDEQKAAAMSELEQALGTYFDQDLQVRRAEFDKVKDEVADLAARLERRASAKDEIVALQLQLLIHEADGLGFFSKPQGPQMQMQYTDPLLPPPAPAPLYAPPAR